MPSSSSGGDRCVANKVAVDEEVEVLDFLSSGGWFDEHLVARKLFVSGGGEVAEGDFKQSGCHLGGRGIQGTAAFARGSRGVGIDLGSVDELGVKAVGVELRRFCSGQKRDLFPVGLKEGFPLADISGHGLCGFFSLGVGAVERFGLGFRGRLAAALHGKTPDVGRHFQRFRGSLLGFANGLGQDNLCGLGRRHCLTGLLDRLLGLLKIRCLSVAHADGAVILRSDILGGHAHKMN